MSRSKAQLSLVATVGDGLSSKLDKLAASLADALLHPDVPIAEKIAGLKALASYRDQRKTPGVKNAFDGYREALSGTAEDEPGDAA